MASFGHCTSYSEVFLTSSWIVTVSDSKLREKERDKNMYISTCCSIVSHQLGLYIRAEFKIRNGKYMDKWPNSLTSVWPCTKVYGHFVDLVGKVLIK